MNNVVLSTLISKNVKNIAALACCAAMSLSAVPAYSDTSGSGDAGWSLFGPVNGSGWSLFGPVNGSGWGVGGQQPAGAGQQGWSLFGPVNGSGWSLFGSVHGSGWGFAPQGYGVPHPAMQQPPALVAIHCTFGEETMLLAKSIDDCENAGGTVHQALKDAQAAASGN